MKDLTNPNAENHPNKYISDSDRIKKIELKLGELSKQKEKNIYLGKDLGVPLLLILFSGLVGIAVGYFWEDFKFKKDTVFSKKIEYIIESRKEATDLFINVDSERRFIRSLENQSRKRNLPCTYSDYAGQIERIKRSALRVNYLSEFSKGILTDNAIPTNVQLFTKELDSYIKCLIINNDCNCTNEYIGLMDPLRKIIDLHTQELNKQITDN